MGRNEIVVASTARSPFGRHGGLLTEFDYCGLGATLIAEVINRVKISVDVANQLFWGVGDASPTKDVYTPVAARQALLKAGGSSGDSVNLY